MENIEKLQNGLFAIYSFVDSAHKLQEGLASNISLADVKEAIDNVGLNSDELLYKKHPYRAVLDICEALNGLDITDEQIAEYMVKED